MANYVKIGSLGPRLPDYDPEEAADATADRMIAFWRGKLESVLPDKPDLIVVPEACDRPNGTPKKSLADYYRARGDRVRDFFSDVAKANGCYVAYSAIREIPEEGTWRNSTVIFDRQGEPAGVYNKNHVVIEERTVQNILYGKDAPLIECAFGRVACAICFDLNFDELRLKYAAAGPDLIVFCSMYHGGLMQRYWAYSCRAHFVGAIHNSPCAVISPTGEMLASSTNYQDYVIATVNLDCRVCHYDYNGQRFREMKKKYGPKVRIADPGYLGSVLVSSETDEFTVEEVLDEFHVERLDDYFKRALAHRHAEGNMER